MCDLCFTCVADAIVVAPTRLTYPLEWRLVLVQKVCAHRLLAEWVDQHHVGVVDGRLCGVRRWCVGGRVRGSGGVCWVCTHDLTKIMSWLMVRLAKAPSHVS